MLKRDIEEYAKSEPLDRFVPVEIDIETPEGKKIDAKYGIKGIIPAIVFLNKDGKEISRKVGTVAKEELGQFFADVRG